MKDWGRESEALFGDARRVLSPSTEDRARVRARLAARLGAAAMGASVVAVALPAVGATVAPATPATIVAVAGGATGTPGAGAAAGAAVASTSVLAKVVGALLVVVAVGGGLGVARSATPSTGATPARSPAPIAGRIAALATGGSRSIDRAPSPAEGAPAIPTLGSPRDLPSAPSAVATSIAPRSNVAVASAGTAVEAATGASALAPDAPSSSEELALVGAIDAALRAGDPARALARVADHERAFPSGRFVEEREGGRVIARCMSGAGDVRSVRAFVDAHPRSPMRLRVVAACGESELPAGGASAVR